MKKKTNYKNSKLTQKLGINKPRGIITKGKKKHRDYKK